MALNVWRNWTAGVLSLPVLRRRDFFSSILLAQASLRQTALSLSNVRTYATIPPNISPLGCLHENVKGGRKHSFWLVMQLVRARLKKTVKHLLPPPQKRHSRPIPSDPLRGLRQTSQVPVKENTENHITRGIVTKTPLDTRRKAYNNIRTY